MPTFSYRPKQDIERCNYIKRACVTFVSRTRDYLYYPPTQAIFESFDVYIIKIGSIKEKENLN